MKYKRYRICLLSLVVVAVIGGIFYYMNYVSRDEESQKGTFVERIIPECIIPECMRA